MAKVLVTGGAGYIGSHAVKLLGEQGHEVVVLDNLGKGFRAAVLYGELIEGDTGDQALVREVLEAHRIRAVMHFAAHTIVPESVSDPIKYYRNNSLSTLNLLECCAEAGVEQFIFSSTAAVYGIPTREDLLSAGIDESCPTAPINPYGASKLVSEIMLRDICAASGMKHVILRYFNVAGCDPEGRIGQSTPGATLLIKVAAEVAEGKREHLQIFGTDYHTPDGTGVRDYIHVTDLAEAHLKALSYLERGGESATLNCGYGRGYSVRQVVEAVNRLYGRPIKVLEVPRRAGDPPMLVANAERIKTQLGWQPAYDDLDLIVKSSLEWEQNRHY